MWVNHSNGALRVSAYSILDAWNLYSDSRMKNGLIERVKLFYPQLFEEDKVRCAVISGLRPVATDELPIIGHLCHRYENVYINGGGGYDGFLLAAGSAVLISEIVQQTVLNCMTPSTTMSSDTVSSDAIVALPGLSEQIAATMVALFSPLNRVCYSPRFCRLCKRRWKEEK